ncbi:hypothetical protein CCP4SC76_6850004 [Gammaproteobacteria bacterium]
MWQFRHGKQLLRSAVVMQGEVVVQGIVQPLAARRIGMCSNPLGHPYSLDTCIEIRRVFSLAADPNHPS